jgi:4-hydroxy-4-methyl-2-oxoglutarate aldolase
MEIPDWLNSTLASDAAAGAGAIASLAPLRPGQLAVGPASTVSVAPGDNADLREAVRGSDGMGRVLVVAGSADSERAVIGDLMGAWIEARGFKAVVVEGRVRDVGLLRTLRLQVWCAGVTPVAAAKKGGGSAGRTVRIGSVAISPGDLVIADDDGVVVWPADRVPELIELARDRLEKDRRRSERLAEGGELE